MSYWNKSQGSSYPKVDSVSLIKRGDTINEKEEFYEIEPGLVLDIILDKNHKFFQKNPITINPDKWPANIEGKISQKNDVDYTWIGRVLVRLIYTQRNVEKEDLVWAIPLESNISEYPVLNEIVGVVNYLGQYYYTRKINFLNVPNSNVDFNLELSIGGFKTTPTAPTSGNRELITDTSQSYRPYQGPISKTKIGGGTGYQGALGRYFLFNPRIRSLKRREGDLLIESRFGQSIRFASYDDIRDNDKGYNSNFNGYKDYKGDGTKYKIDGIEYETGGGNPMILIRNRQRTLTNVGQQTKIYENIPPIIGTEEEKNFGGYITEDINNDGSSIHITSGTTLSGFKSNCSKIMWGNESEEQTEFNGNTKFKFPLLLGDQIVINSDRIILSAKSNETFHFSKKRYAIVTDDEYTVDAHKQIVFTTNSKTVLNSPAIYLGEYDQTNEPVLLGQTTINWLYDLVQWLLTHTHWYKHTHPDAGKAIPDKTQTTVQASTLMSLRDQLSSLMSKRVFVVGGGLAPGKNGGEIKNGEKPVKITVSTGDGVPGGYTASSKKIDPTQKNKPQSDLDVEIAQNAALEASTALTNAKVDIEAIKSIITSIKELINGNDSVDIKKAAMEAINAHQKSTKHISLVNKHALKSQNAANNAAVTPNNLQRTSLKNEAVDESSKAKQEAQIISDQRKISENAFIKAQVSINSTI